MLFGSCRVFRLSAADTDSQLSANSIVQRTFPNKVKTHNFFQMEEKKCPLQMMLFMRSELIAIWYVNVNK